MNEWIKSNVTIFLDQNIQVSLTQTLRDLGYDVEDVYSIGYKGANDGKLLKILRDRKYILVTYDRKFYRMTIKYNKMAILIHTTQENKFRGKSIIGIIVNELHSNLKLLEDYYGR